MSFLPKPVPDLIREAGIQEPCVGARCTVPLYMSLRGVRLWRTTKQSHRPKIISPLAGEIRVRGINPFALSPSRKERAYNMSFLPKPVPDLIREAGIQGSPFLNLSLASSGRGIPGDYVGATRRVAPLECPCEPATGGRSNLIATPVSVFTLSLSKCPPSCMCYTWTWLPRQAYAFHQARLMIISWAKSQMMLPLPVYS